MNLVLFTCVSGRLFQRAIGAYQVAHYLRQHGFSVQVIDFTDELTEAELIGLVDKFVTSETLAVGVSTTFYSSLEDKFIAAKKTFNAIIPQALENAVRYAKAKQPKVKIVFGGSRSLSALQLDYVDCVIHGYGEDKLLNYLRELKGERPRVFAFGENLKRRVITDDIDPKFDIQALAHRFTAEDHVLPGEVLPIEISRGCIFKCKFCAYPLNGKKKLDYLRDAQLFKEELLYNYEQFGTTNYFFNDDTFNDSTAKLEALHRVITELPFKINFTCYLRLDLLYSHQEQVELVREMGLASPFFGIESLNQQSATTIGKGMKTAKVKDFLLELYEHRWKQEVPITCSYIVGLPHETKETVRETFNWAKSTGLSSTFFGLSLDTKSFYVSEFNKDHGKYGYQIIDPVKGSWRNDNFTYDEAVQLADEFNTELMYSSDKPSSWFLITLLNHDMSLEEARSTKVKDLNWRHLVRSKKRKLDAYKAKLL